MKILIKEEHLKFITENYLRADKLFFKTNILNDEEKELIMKVFGKNNPYFILGAEFVKYFKRHTQNIKTIETFLIRLNILIEYYDKSVFPLQYNLLEYNDETDDNFKHILTLYELLESRYEMVNKFKKLPSIAIRNFKDIKQKKINSSYECKIIKDKIENLLSTLKRIEEIGKLEKYIHKIFNSKNSFDDSIKIASLINEKLSYNTINHDEIYEFIDESNNSKIIKDADGILILKISNHNDLIQLTCNSLWCFSRPNSTGYWSQYASYGYVYVIFNFNLDNEDSMFMSVYLPDGQELYDTNNNYVEHYYEYFNEYNIKDEDFN